MIHIEEKPIEPDENGSDLNITIKVSCESMKDVLREYSYLTAHIRDMLILGGVDDKEKLDSTVYTAFRIGMDKIPHTKDAQLVVDGMSQHKKLS